MGPHRRRSRSSRQRHPQHVSGIAGQPGAHGRHRGGSVTSSCVPEGDKLDDLWWQCRAALEALAGNGYVHGDLSAYNVLVHHGRLVLIDLPQVVDVVGNPKGRRTSNATATTSAAGSRRAANPTPTPANWPPRSPPKLASSASTSCPPVVGQISSQGSPRARRPAWSKVNSLLNGWNLMPRTSR